MDHLIPELKAPLFDGIEPENRTAMMACIGYYILPFRKGDIITLESETVSRIGIVLSGVVDMVKEDVWGNRTILMRLGQNELFGETFACGTENQSVVTFTVSEDATILFFPFGRAMHCCANSCEFHHRLIENLLRIIADKNQNLMRKLEVVSKRTIREKLLTYLSIQAQAQKSRYFQIPLGRGELAEYLCVDRSALTRELVKMKEEQLLDYDRNWFRLR